MESSEHNRANIAENICPEMLVFDKQASWMLLFSEYPDKSQTSQINTLLLPYFISYYSPAFTINQFHNHDAEVYAPQRLVLILNLKQSGRALRKRFYLFAFILNYYNVIILFLLLSKQCIDFSFQEKTVCCPATVKATGWSRHNKGGTTSGWLCCCVRFFRCYNLLLPIAGTCKNSPLELYFPVQSGLSVLSQGRC